jgi:hypothetical protein
MARTRKQRTYLDLGSYNVTCDRCGRKLKNWQVSKEWTGLIVCAECIDERQPQDFVRGRVDHISVPFARPVPAYDYQVVSPTGISGTLSTALPSGPEDTWDLGNVVHVTLFSGQLTSALELDVLNGANLCAINGSNGWEVIQYQDAFLVSGTTYICEKLLRARYGTELAMGAPEGSEFIYMGQSSPSLRMWMETELYVDG